MLLLIETALVLIAVVIALVRPRLGDRWFAPVERRFARLARRRGLSVIVVGATALGLRVLLLPVLPIPEPAVHDEFSYLLAADTFAHGRLANPTHPMWVHFETFHVNMKPTYVSMYYPAQGMFLAFGQVVFGHPFWGVWLSAGLMCAAICWMLQGWVAPVWALMGGFLAVIRLGTFSYWMNSYWGGAVAALGGALVLGALPRIKRRQRLRDVILMGLGFAIIANSRPYEGIFFSIPVFLTLILWMRRPSAPPFRIIAKRVVAPLLVIFVLTLGWMGYYFWRTTGSPIRTPFQVNVSTYNPVPYFPWQSVRAVPNYNSPEMQHFYNGWWISQFRLDRSHPVVLLVLKFFVFWTFYFGPLLLFPLIAACFVLPYGISFRELNARTKIALLTLLVVIIGSALPVYFNPHYVAAVTSLLYLFMMIALQQVRKSGQRKGRGIAIVRATFAVAIIMLAVYAVFPRRYRTDLRLMSWYSPFVGSTFRSELHRELSAMPGSEVVFVRYAENHDPRDEWVYNSADIGSAKVVWARDMGPEKNGKLINYFHGRQVWVVEPDIIPPKLSPYDASSDNQTPTPFAGGAR